MYKRQHLTIDREQEGWDGHVGFVPNYVKELNMSVDKTALICGPPIMIKFCLLYTSFHVAGPDFSEDFTLPVHGVFNVENAVAAIAAAWSMGIPVSLIKESLLCVTVPGRMETRCV